MKYYLHILLTLFLIFSCKNAPDASVSSNTTKYSKYSAKQVKQDKKKYYDGNREVYEIKYKTDGFKLRTNSSELIYKVKLYDDKIKISDNEENLNPYEIKLNKADNKAKLIKSNKELAKLNFYPDRGEHKVKLNRGEEIQIRSKQYSSHLLVQQISVIPEDQQHIIMDELKAKGY